MKLGIIAEDESDVAVLRQLTLTLLRPHQIGFKRFVGRGCGKVRHKCANWAVNLVEQGCTWVVVVHDLDLYNEHQLRLLLQRSIAPAQAQAKLVLIPKKTIEAWLLYDPRAIARTFRQTRELRLPGNPESLVDPKAFLRELIWRKYQKIFLHTVHNEQIAIHIEPGQLRRSTSFTPHFAFTEIIKRSARRAQR